MSEKENLCPGESMMNFGLRAIVPTGAVVVDAVSERRPCDLLPEEARQLGRVSEKRHRDYSLGRSCAHRALAQLGFEPGPILRGPMREPLWPANVSGSITHCEGYAAAAVCRQSIIQSIGIDAEPRRQLAAGVLNMVATKKEVEWIGRSDRRIPWDLILFSAKESVFKAWFPLTRTWLGFDEAEIEFDLNQNEFAAKLSPAAAALTGVPDEICGRYYFGEKHVFTCAFIAAQEFRTH